MDNYGIAYERVCRELQAAQGARAEAVDRCEDAERRLTAALKVIERIADRSVRFTLAYEEQMDREALDYLRRGFAQEAAHMLLDLSDENAKLVEQNFHMARHIMLKSGPIKFEPETGEPDWKSLDTMHLYAELRRQKLKIEELERKLRQMQNRPSPNFRG